MNIAPNTWDKVFVYVLKLVSQFCFKAASAALFGILLLLAFVFTAPMGSHDYLVFIVMIIYFLCLGDSSLFTLFKT
jgi:hypothetical protein